MAKVYYDQDANLEVLKDKTIAIVGFGNQGGAQAQNLKDSGLNVIIAEVEGTPNWNRAKELGFEVMDASTAAKRGDIVQILIPDEMQAGVYKKFIKKFMKNGKTLMFSHGFNVHFKAIKPAKDINVIMVAPKGPGFMVRETYNEGKGVPALIAVYQDATGNAKDLALAYAKGIGGTRAGVFETTFKEEVETDLFGEQTVLCGGCTSLVKAGFETLVEAGYQPEMAYFECVHELKLIVDLIYKQGIAGMRKAISNTAEFGDLTVGPEIISEKVKKQMGKALKNIQSGKFARKWLKDHKDGYPIFSALREKDQNHQIEKVGAELRSMMSWLKK
ncbi:ketol-acid reductoisomerase [candidate division WOR-1 bacterium RIFOXYB2_FULL_42_35]|uniref:Ketol-acid reductoisomerase (NADP(+)) n=1 Tax=candidate division WOR-1 bacterium RIFOXYC2_FULL_41_25 TaxID=1802586 RepID=A0A1F4TK45_UNCSA|nr:MAG: ketol-acid reductoisomerase [candidate division WOR-1 bacterium RIFOXYA2_FULL_41_14]OGC22422.1 MAG: ketol-acid reductoisomerase [candidate division WOR-1 bacterium RIFOXYB2_FULL_42_35]OGC33101.1 MAG: ketol-acid reductoisomerase [candidate division WOR-1 bacterium RIFOXYC2_FULL_41_25]OGC42914.1 MAG: ketol-acid reductoisomerase [candidate division WOR-1 bacterium RIFOXYD2_FULL_41_8]